MDCISVRKVKDYLYEGSTECRLLFHSINDHEVEVLAPEGEKPQGHISIPRCVDFDGRTFTVSVIGNKAFYQCSELEGISIPDTVVRLEPESFRESGLTAFQAAGVEGVDYSAFFGCKRLECVELPRLQWMGISAFSRCEKLAEFVLPATLQEIPNWAFDFNAFTKILVPNSVKRIGDQAFYNCGNLEQVIIPSSVDDICTEAFVGTQIRSVVIPNPDAGVRWNAFPEGCEVTQVKN